MLRIHAYSPEIGGEISPNGNPVILAIDKNVGIVVAIEVESQYWKTCLEKLGQLRGVGILPANHSDITNAAKGRNGS